MIDGHLGGTPIPFFHKKVRLSTVRLLLIPVLAALVSLSACSGSGSGGGGSPPSGPTPSGVLVLTAAGASQPVASSPSSPFNISYNVPSVFTVTESGFSGNFTVQVIANTNGGFGNCMVPNPPSTPYAFGLYPQGTLCQGQGRDIETVQITDGLGNTLLEYFRLI